MSKASVVKANLTQELAFLLKNAAADHTSEDTLSSELVQSLCCIIEAVFIHGLKKAFYGKKPRNAKYPEPNFWPFISKNSQRAVLKQIESSKLIKTEIGKCRAWIRVVLNDGVLEHYLNLFSHNTATISKFYEKYSFLRDSEQMNILIGYLKGLMEHTINAPINSSLLNAWTPSPLILSGIMPGKPTRLEELRKLRQRGLSLGNLEVEKAEGAIECFEESVYDSSSSAEMDFSRTLCAAEDDKLSEYSHPSLLDGGWKLSRTNLAGSSLLASPISEDNENDPHRVNVVRRVHRYKTKSSKGSSDGDSSNTASLASLPSTSGKHERTIEKETLRDEQHDVQKYVNETNTMKRGVEEHANAPDKQYQTSNGAETKNAEKDIVADAGKSIDSGVVASALPNSFDDRPLGSNTETEAVVAESPTKANGSGAVVVTLKRAEAEQHTVLLVQNFHGTGASIDIPEKENVNEDSLALSLQDELLLAEGLPRGNSLLGKGWIEPPQIVAPTDDGRVHYSSTSSDSSRVFNTEMQSVMDKVFNKDAMFGETDSEAFADEIATLMHNDAMRINASRPNEGTSSEKASNGESNDSQRRPLLSSEIVNTLLTSIPREKGLDAQDFRCPSCRKSIGPTFAKYKVCGFDGLYYCEGCWKSEESVIPARLVHNWDSKPRPVCRPNMLLIERIRDKAVIRIDQINPRLYEICAPMKTVKLLREKLSLTVLYLLSCRKSVADDLEQRIWPKDYLYKDIHLYSFADLLMVLSGHFERHLNNLITYTIDHIHVCALCSQKGFICEICSSRQIIYPFQIEITFRCSECFSVYHKDCIRKQRCPKCVRREKYSQNPNIADDHLLLD